MCLGIPGRLVEIDSENGLLMAKVDFGGVYKRICLQHTPEARLGDYVIVHVGFSLSIIDPDEAQQVFRFLEQAGHLEELQDSFQQSSGNGDA